MRDTAYDLYVVTHGLLDDPFWKRVQHGMETAASLYGVDATLVTPDNYEDGHAAELRRVLDEHDPDGLAVTISDPTALEPPIRRAVERERIPTVAINIADFREQSKRLPYACYIGMDETICGNRLARATLDRTADISRGAVVIHERGHAGLDYRAEGIREVFAEHGLPVDVLECQRDRDLIRDRINSYHDEHPDLDVVFTLGEPGTKPVFDYLTAHDYLGDVDLAVVDGLLSIDSAETFIRDGRVVCSVEQDPFLQGFLPVLELYELLEGTLSWGIGDEPRSFGMGPDVVDQYTVDKEVQNQLLRKELLQSLDQLDEEEKRALVDRVNETFTNHESMAVVGSQIVATLLPHLL